MENQKIMLIHAVPAAAQMRQVSKFNPLRLLKQEVSKETGEKKIKMDLRYKKLWFRLACPNGRLIHSAIRVTDQVAVFEARVFLNCEDTLPVSTFTVSKSKDEVPDGNIVQAAQDSAMDEALDAAGFGIQLCEVDRSVIESATVAEESRENNPPAKSSPAPQPKQVLDNPPSTSEPQKASASPAPVSSSSVSGSEPPEDLEAGEPARITPAPANPPASNSYEHGSEISEALDTLHVLEGKKQKPSSPAAQTPKTSDTGSSSAPTATADAAPAPSNAANEADPSHEDKVLTETDILAKYSDDMAVEDICSTMTPEEASALVIHNGINKGWSMGEIARKRAASLKFYAYLDDECGNVIKAAALTLMDAQPLLKAS